MPRYFSLLEAEALLPSIATQLDRLLALKLQYEEAERDIQIINRRIMMTGGMVPPRAQVVELKRHKETAARGLKETFEALQETGCHLKDLDIGLIDFPTLYRGKEVYLCWKRGEEGIGFWHRVEDGYAGRRRIDSDFLSHHGGEGTQ